MKAPLAISIFIVSLCQVGVSQPYFQQEVNYKLSVSLNDVNHTLSGFESIQYINHSPNVLKFMYFHLWPNAYKDNSTALAHQLIENGLSDFYFTRPDERGFIDSIDFRVDGETIKWNMDWFASDICKLFLNDPLYPGDTIIVSTPFYVKIPGSFSRFGHVGQSYQITQWYPKPAVYDRNGWNQMSYLDQGEFYSEFGMFDVSITLPANYVVGATGDLMTQKEIGWLEKKCSDSMLVENFPASDTVLKTLRYRQDNIHDFAWFADKRYHVEKGEVELNGGKKVTTWVMYTKKEAYLWKHSIEFVNDAVRYYSDLYGNYPYNNCTAVYGAMKTSGAMEYPTIAVVGDAPTISLLENWIVHEVGHNWFYGIMGFNERRYPYLDEGINTFSDFRYMMRKYPGLKFSDMVPTLTNFGRILNMDKLPAGSYYQDIYLTSARNNADQPLNLTGEAYTAFNYGSIVYYKTALAFNYLLQYLGEKKFNHIMGQFCNEWKFKHPGPEDLQKAFESDCKMDLSWFFKDLTGTRNKIDYALKRMGSDKVLVKNTGQIASPVSLTAIKQDGSKETKWYPGFSGKQWLGINTEKAKKIRLFDDIWLPELNGKNNMLNTHGSLKWMEPLNIRLIQVLENQEETRIGVLPSVGWNNYNKLLLGIIFYSPLIPRQTLEYQLMPMVALGNHDVAGVGRVVLNLRGFSFLQGLQLIGDARRFGYDIYNGNSYNRLKGEMVFTFRNVIARSPVLNTLKFALVTADEVAVFHELTLFEKYFLTMDASHSNRNILNPHTELFNVEVNNDYVKSSLEFNYSHAMKYDGNAIHIRFYASCFIKKTSDFPDFYEINLSGASGLEDYKYDHLYLGRFEDIRDPNRQRFLSQQFVISEGGFISYNPYAKSDKWLATLGITVKAPVVPLFVFANAGTYAGAGSNSLMVSGNVINSSSIAFEMGVMINLGNVIRVYFPFVTSPDIRKVNELYTNNGMESIRYIIDLNALNPFRIRNRLINRL
jgi:hypothetical protein